MNGRSIDSCTLNIGATVAALVVIVLGKPLCEWLLICWTARLGETQSLWLGVVPSISYPCAAAGALFGGYSHVFLDSIMHSDMQPLAPFSADNALLYAITIDQLHTLCLALGTPGVVALLIILVKRKRAAS